MKDMANKGRSYRSKLKGEECGNSKLTKKQVKKIRKLYSSKQYTKTRLSKMFNVSDSNIHMIINNKTWRE